MIDVQLVLYIGSRKDDVPVWLDEFTMFSDESVNDFLDTSNCHDGDIDYAELRLLALDKSFLICSFKQIKLKGKGYRWVVGN